MIITSVQIRLFHDPRAELLAYAAVTFDDCFMVRDIKIIRRGGASFVAMPSRKLNGPCQKCGCKNSLQAKHCGDCAAPLPVLRLSSNGHERQAQYLDVAHPINARCRNEIQTAVLNAYAQELARSERNGAPHRGRSPAHASTRGALPGGFKDAAQRPAIQIFNQGAVDYA